MSQENLPACRKTIELGITKDVPEENITITKLPKGFTITAEHNTSETNDDGWSKSSHVFSATQSFGRAVKNATGGFNKDGKYEVNVEFDE